MPNHKGFHLLNNLETNGADKGVFGIAYSILTWGGVGKGAGCSFSAVKKTAGKLIEDGHATTFMIDKNNELFVMTGIGDSWVFYGGDLASQDWARQTTSANTDVYYTGLDATQVEKYWNVKEELQASDVNYSELWPNVPGFSRYENCISSSHYVVYKMGLGKWASTKGSWVPSMSNWMTWAATKASSWKHRRFDNCNTHFPDDPGHVYFGSA